MDRGGWWAIVHRVTKSWTQLKRLSMRTRMRTRAHTDTHTYTHTHTLDKKTTRREAAPGEGNTTIISGRMRQVGGP